MASAVLGSSLEHIGVVSVAQMPCAIEENRRSRGAEGLEDVNCNFDCWSVMGVHDSLRDEGQASLWRGPCTLRPMWSALDHRRGVVDNRRTKASSQTLSTVQMRCIIVGGLSSARGHCEGCWRRSQKEHWTVVNRAGKQTRPCET
jgi:hypothetical protein